MKNENNSYRIRTDVGSDSSNVLNVKLNQTFEFLNILSLRIGQKNLYKMPASTYGVVCGRVLLGGKSFGIQNAKVSVFIPKDGTVFDVKDDILYTYSSVDSVNYDGVRYNLLPSYVDNDCHQNVGTMFEKEYVLDNNDVIRIFDTYYTYTTTTNNAGDYFIYGVPVGQHTLHVDVDLSDIGKLSVRPHDMIGQGYNIDQFESPNKFKADKNLNILPQIKSQNKPLYVYPFWGDTSEDDTNAMITRADIEIDYKFEPTAVFIGSIVTDKGSNSISHKCVPNDLTGKMSELVTGEGVIEMIRKTFDGKVEQFSVKGNRLIDGDGIWCYQVPMNLDYVCMDEFGNIVPTDNPEKGIPTRARVRFRISLDENPMDDSARKRARFLVPNNPRLTDDYPDFQSTHEPDYEFGTYTKEESYRDMFWNNVYTVKSYIPRLQKRTTTSTKKYTGIKMTNHAGDNNPMPYNNLAIRMGFVYRFLCVLLTVFIYLVEAINTVLALIGYAFVFIGDIFFSIGDAITGILWGLLDKPGEWFKKIGCWFYGVAAGMLIDLDDFCDDGNMTVNYMPGPGIVKKFIETIVLKCDEVSCLTDMVGGQETSKCNKYANAETEIDRLLNCIQNALAQDNEVTSFDFQNDWVNGVLYAPLWYRKIKPKRRIFFGLIKTGSVDEWCDGNSSKMSGRDSLFSRGLKLYQTCAQQREFEANNKRIKAIDYEIKNTEEANCYGFKCHKRTLSVIQVDKGIIIRKETKYGEYVYYYKSVEYSKDNFRNVLNGTPGDIKIIFATDLVLLGSLNDCDEKGIPQFFKHLNETTYQMPPDLLSMSWEVNDQTVTPSSNDDMNDSDSNSVNPNTVHTEYTGADWGNAGFDQWYKYDNYEGEYIKDGERYHDNGGVFYGINCNFSYVKPKSCVNLTRACEFGVTLDQSITFIGSSEEERLMAPDGYISYDEIYNHDARAMFATMNGNRLREKQDPRTGFPTYDFNYLYPENFDGTMYNLMNEVNRHPDVDDNGYPYGGQTAITYKENYKIEASSDAYLRFRYGFDPKPSNFAVTFYDNNIKLGWFMNDDLVSLNQRRFPRYENSFYFYFGLKTGKTAIDKFRRNYYAECRNDEPSENSLSIEYQANSWCNNEPATMRDGYVKFDLCNIEMPCSISFNERNHNMAGYDETYTDINDCKIYIGGTDDQFFGYTKLYVDDNNRAVRRNRFNNGSIHAPTIPNGYYVVTIVDASGEQYRENIVFEAEKLKYNTSSTAFTITNSEMKTTFPPYGGRSTNQRVAEDTTHNLSNTNYIRDIGGYITVSMVTYQNEALSDNFVITVEPYDKTMEWYNGTVYSVINGSVDITGVPPLSISDGEYVFPVPKGNEYYTVTIVEYCSLLDNVSNNSVVTRVYVNEPVPFRMFVNGVDTELLKNFKVGFQKDNYGVINAPYIGYNPTEGVKSDLPGSVRGWLTINDIGISSLISYDQSSYVGDVMEAVNALAPNPDTLYNFTEEYTFQESDINKSLNTYSSIPNLIGMDNVMKYIRVKRNGISGYGYGRGEENYDPFDETTWIYELVNNSAYELKRENGEPAIDISLEEYFNMNTGDGQNKRYVIDTLNSIIRRRMDLVQSMINAFWMYDNNEENKTISITFQTNETPVKTLIYYIPDDNNTLRLISNETAYVILDRNKDENTITSFSRPTITKNGDNTKPIFTNISTIPNQTAYKLPPHCGIKNNMGVTIPKTLTTSPFDNNVGIVNAMSALDGGMDNMFGFHVIDKRPFTKANIWVPLNEQPIYWPDVEDDPQIDTGTPSEIANFVENGTFNMNGCVSGYFYNGFSTSNDRNARFVTQKATNDIGIYTITTLEDSTTKPNEFAVPTKRVMYRPAPEDNYQPNYNDFFRDDNYYEGFDADAQGTSGTDSTRRYISYDGNTNYLSISDERASFNENLHPTANFGIPEDMVVGKGMQIKPVFSGIEGVVNYTVINGIYPVYRKVYNNDQHLPVDTSNWNMVYGASLPSNNPTIQTGNDVKRVYFIGYIADGKYRGISPVYEVSQVNITFENDGTHPIITVNMNPDTDYYLLHYNYRIVLTYNIDIDGYTTQGESVSQYISQGSTEPYAFMDVDINAVTNIKVYIKDITGIRRTTNI